MAGGKWIRCLCLALALCVAGCLLPAASAGAAEGPDAVEVTFTRMDHSIGDDRGSIQLYFDLAQVPEDYPAHEAVNQALEQEYQRYLENIEGLEENLGDGADELFYTKTGEVTFDRDGILSLRYEMEWFMGGVYNSGWNGITFDLATGERATLPGLLGGDPAELLTRIQDEILDFAAVHGGWDWDTIVETVRGYTLDGLDFYIAEDGELTICIPEYELAPGAGGPMRIPCGMYVGAAPATALDDAIARQEELPVLPLDGDRQYEMNVFLSNFSEQGFGSYDGTADGRLAAQVDFIHIFRKINDRDAIVYKNDGGSPYETLTMDQINETMDRFFGETITSEQAREYPVTNHSFYRDGDFYFVAADGEAYNRFTVADSVRSVSDQVYLVYFTVYELDLMTYFDEGIGRAYYEMTPAAAQGSGVLSADRCGAALVAPWDNNGRNTYRLLEYRVF